MESSKGFVEEIQNQQSDILDFIKKTFPVVYEIIKHLFKSIRK